MDKIKNKTLFERFRDIAKEFAPCMHDYLYIFDIRNDVYFITENALSRFNIEKNLFTNVTEVHRLFVHPDDYDMLQKDLGKMIQGEKDEHNLQYRWLGKSGEPIWINCKGRIVFDNDGRRSLMIGCINEIGKNQKADNISGLLSETSLFDFLVQLRSTAKDMMLLRIGIDDFRELNERYNREYGNFILYTMAERIKKLLGENQYIYRLASDEFMILDLSDSDFQKMKELYQSIRSMVDNLVAEENYKAVYTISGGLVSSKDVERDHDILDIMKLSAFALSEAKARGKNQMYFFCKEDYSNFQRRTLIRDYLRKSVNNGMEGFSLNFQPIVLSNDETLYAAETLLRFRTPTGENITPYEFIPILEETGLIIPVGKWILNKALKFCKKYREIYPNFAISINFSYVQILKSPLFQDILNALNEVDISPCALIVELTESGYLENSFAVQHFWEELRNIGVNIALDDFGTGYSNLLNISNLKPNIVKVDRKFTIKALNNSYEHEILSNMIRMIHSIGLRLVAEGIETREELVKINEMKPDMIQGYYYSKPCSESEFSEKYLR